jgi:hypothetical protein
MMDIPVKNNRDIHHYLVILRRQRKRARARRATMARKSQGNQGWLKPVDAWAASPATIGIKAAIGVEVA